MVCNKSKHLLKCGTDACHTVTWIIYFSKELSFRVLSVIPEAKLALSLLDFVCIKARDFTAAFAFLNQTLGLSFL